MQKQAPELVIFDCDGVLVDSEPISVSVLVDIISNAGGKINEELAYSRLLGMSMASVGEILDREFGFVLTDEHLEKLRADLERRFKVELRPMPGIIDLLQALGPRRCVASSSSIERIRLSLGVTGLLELLEPHLYSAGMVERGKPAPDLFLYAAREMGVAPSACIVIEDSPAGVAAARSAGMRVLGFVGGSHAGKAGLSRMLSALDPEHVFDDMAQLPSLLAGKTRGMRDS